MKRAYDFLKEAGDVLSGDAGRRSAEGEVVLHGSYL